MSNGPVTGNGIAITLPEKKFVFWSALAQAAFSQYVQLKDAAGNPVFTAQGASAAPGQPTQIGQGVFTVPTGGGDYTVWIGTNGGAKWSQVLWQSEAITLGSSVFYGSYCFIAEDSTDQDYNDTCLQLNWFQYIG